MTTDNPGDHALIATLSRRGFLIAFSTAAGIACDRSRESTLEHSLPKASASSATPPRVRLSPWDPVDEMFRGCEGSCGARVAGGSADVVVQPGARLGQRTYCPVSAVVFTVHDASPRQEVDGRSIYLCCPGCAQYFVKNRVQIIAVRRLVS